MSNESEKDKSVNKADKSKKWAENSNDVEKELIIGTFIFWTKILK